MKVKTRTPYDDGEFNQSNLFYDVMKQVLVGAGIAGGVVIGAGVFIYVLYLIGTLLPPESKQAADPTPDSFYSEPE